MDSCVYIVNYEVSFGSELKVDAKVRPLWNLMHISMTVVAAITKRIFAISFVP